MEIEYTHTASIRLHEVASSLVNADGFEKAKDMVRIWRESCGNNNDEAAIVMAAMCIGAMSILEMTDGEENESLN